MLYKATLVIYDSTRPGVLLEETDGCDTLPYVEVAVSEPGIVAPLNVAVQERFGLDVITLRYVPTGRSRADDSVDAVFFMETRDRLDASVSGGRWVGRGEISGIEFERTAGPHVESFMRDVSSDGQVHPLRAEWAKAGWFRDIAAWIEATLERSGYALTGRVEQVRHVGILVARIPAIAEPAQCRRHALALAHHQRSTSRLNIGTDAASNVVPVVVAVEPARGWTLMEAFAQPETRGVATIADALQVLAGLQRKWVGRTDELLGIGCPDRRLETVPVAAVQLMQRDDVRYRIDPSRRAEVDAALDDLPELCALRRARNAAPWRLPSRQRRDFRRAHDTG